MDDKLAELDDRQLDQVSGGIIDCIPLPFPKWPRLPRCPTFPPLPRLEA